MLATFVITSLSASLAVSLFFCIKLNTVLNDAIKILKFYARLNPENPTAGEVARNFISKWGF